MCFAFTLSAHQYWLTRLFFCDYKKILSAQNAALSSATMEVNQPAQQIRCIIKNIETKKQYR